MNYPTCSECGSGGVKVDAFAVWDIGLQDWVLDATFDAAYCEECDGETSLAWKEQRA